jgi:NSS family neurotransmitter:Na+ symporter
MEKRGGWGSKMAFILAASGSAIGLGNIWRFPYQTGMNGGAAFVLIYIIAAFTVGLTLFLAEVSLGRATKRNPVGAFKEKKPKSPWFSVGILGVFTAVMILSYYAVIAGWTVGYSIKALKGDFSKTLTKASVQKMFSSFSSNIGLNFLLLFIFISLTIIVVSFGIKGGIEKITKILMPVLFIILIYLAIKSVTFEGASKGLLFYLKPDFSKINSKVILYAITQAFFSLSLGMGTIMTYGSYLSDSDYLPSSALWVVSLDTFVAIMAGLIIFPTLFTVPGMSPAQGPSLVFVILPVVFSKISGGAIFGSLFFFLLLIAALTSTISLLEVPVAYLIDEKKWNRKKAALAVGFVSFLFGIPSIFANKPGNFFNNIPFLKKDFLSIMDFMWGNISLLTGGFFIAIFVGYIWKYNNALKEINKSGKIFNFGKLWGFFLKFILPPILFIIILSSILIK